MKEDAIRPVLAVIPARGGSRGLPAKNLRPLRGMPLIAHSIACARLADDVIDRCIVSTDSTEIARVAREHGGDVPFLRPAELAGDAVPMLPVLQHALRTVEETEGIEYGSLLLLDPTSPGRDPDDIRRAVSMLAADPSCDGVIGVSQPRFNPIWHCVVAGQDGYMHDLIPAHARYQRRQDVPDVFRINGCLYLWRREYMLNASDWRDGKLAMLEMPDVRSFCIDEARDLELADVLLASGTIRFPWLP